MTHDILQMQSHNFIVLSAEGLHFSALFIHTLFEGTHITQLVDYLYTKYNNLGVVLSYTLLMSQLSRLVIKWHFFL